MEISFVAWGAVSGRSAEIAEALGGESRCLFPTASGPRPPVLVRYVLAGYRTFAYLVRANPRSVIVTNPPVLAGCVALAWARWSGAVVVLDSHPGGFGAQGDSVSARLQPIHRWLVRRVDLVMVTVDRFCELVETWGGRPVVVHEAPGSWEITSPPRHTPPRILCVGRLAPDEPISALVAAAAAVPECDFWITGDPDRLPGDLLPLAANVTLVGYLDPEAYRAAVHGADILLTLTTEPTSVMRAAYEAVYAGRPLVVSDWPINRTLFPDAVHVGHRPEELADGVRRLCRSYDEVLARAAEARRRQVARWDEQREALLAGISLPNVPIAG